MDAETLKSECNSLFSLVVDVMLHYYTVEVAVKVILYGC